MLRPWVEYSTYIAAKVVKTSYHPQSEAYFKLGKKGVEDIEGSDGYAQKI